MKGKTFKRLAAAALALATVGTSLTVDVGGIRLVDGISLTASAADTVSYTAYKWENNALTQTTETVSDYTVVTKDLIKNSPDGKGLLSGTYVVTEDTTVEDYVYIRKGQTVNLIVPKGVTLTCKQGIGCGYDKNKEYATLNIYGEGKIVATGRKYAAGIGGKDDETNGNITIHGTEIEATGGKHGAGIGGGEGGQDPDASSPTITIYAGKITAKGGVDGAGIGGGDEQPGARTYIYSGDITATSEKHGAGIGGGDEEGTYGIWIYGGTINATGGHHGAGIGAGEQGGNMRNAPEGGINISGASITATGGSGGAGIGGGYDENMSGTITINGDCYGLYVQGGAGAAGIGAGNGDTTGYEGDMKGTITLDFVYKGQDTESPLITGGYGGAGIGAGCAGNMDGKCYLLNGYCTIDAGDLAAGIGGGRETFMGAGGEGGDVYIGGGNFTIFAGDGSYNSGDAEQSYEKKCEASAIGFGNEGDKTGSVYIHSDLNTTGKHMKVRVLDWDANSDPNKYYALTSKRSKCCHLTRVSIWVSECYHYDDLNECSTLSYTINKDGTHTVKCKLCCYEETVAHTPPLCDCGYESGITLYDVELKTDDNTYLEQVAAGQKYTLSEPEYTPEGKRFVYWTQDNSTTEYYPGDSVTVSKNTVFTAHYEDLYTITLENGGEYTVTFASGNYPEQCTLTADKQYADEGDEVKLSAILGQYCRLNSVTIRENNEEGAVLFTKAAEDSDSELIFTMPAGNIYISADFVPLTYNVSVNSTEYGTVEANNTSFDAYSMYFKTVTLTVTPEQGYELANIKAVGDNGTPVNLAKVSDTEYSFTMPGKNVIVSAEFEEVEASAVISSANITLGGELGLNFYVTMNDDEAAGAKAVMNGPEGKKEAELTKSGEYYRVSYPVKAIHADKFVTLTLIDSEGETVDLYNTDGERLTDNEFTYGIYDYVNTAMGLDEEYVTDEQKEQIKAMYTYAAYSVKWKYDTALPTDYVNDLPNITADSLESYKLTASGTENVDLQGASLLLDSNTAFKLYFKCDDTIPEITLNGDIITPVKSGDMYYISVNNIGAKHLKDKFTVVFGDEYTVEFTALSYAYGVLSSTNESIKNDTKLNDIVKAICAYSDEFSASANNG